MKHWWNRLVQTYTIWLHVLKRGNVWPHFNLDLVDFVRAQINHTKDESKMK